MNIKKKILILGGERSQTVSIVRSLGRDYDIYLATSVRFKNRFPKARFSKFVKKNYYYSDPLNHPNKFINDLLKIVKKDNFEFIMGTHETNILPITFYRDDFEKYTTLVHPSNEKLIKTFNKKETLRIAKNLDIKIPLTYDTKFEELKSISKNISYPIVVKPQWTVYWDGYSKNMSRKNIKIVFSKEELLKTFNELTQGKYNPLIQELIPGQGYGALDVLTLLDKNQNLKAIFMQKRLKESSIYGGAAVYWKSIPIINELKKNSLNLLKEMKWEGISMVEYKQDPRDGVPKLMEVNGRFWGTLPLAILCGIDFPILYMKIKSGQENKLINNYLKGIHMKHSVESTHRLFNVLFKKNPSWISRENELKDYIKIFFAKDSLFTLSDPMPSIVELADVSLWGLSNFQIVIKKFINKPLTIN